MEPCSCSTEFVQSSAAPSFKLFVSPSGGDKVTTSCADQCCDDGQHGRNDGPGVHPADAGPQSISRTNAIDKVVLSHASGWPSFPRDVAATSLDVVFARARASSIHER